MTEERTHYEANKYITVRMDDLYTALENIRMTFSPAAYNSPANRNDLTDRWLDWLTKRSLPDDHVAPPPSDSMLYRLQQMAYALDGGNIAQEDVPARVIRRWLDYVANGGDKPRMRHDAEQDDIAKQLAVTDRILENRSKVLDEIGECPVHGPRCVPHALEWIRAVRRLVSEDEIRQVLKTPSSLTEDSVSAEKEPDPPFRDIKTDYAAYTERSQPQLSPGVDVIRKALYDCAQAVADGMPVFDAAYQAAVELGLEEAGADTLTKDGPDRPFSSLTLADSYVTEYGEMTQGVESTEHARDMALLHVGIDMAATLRRIADALEVYA